MKNNYDYDDIDKKDYPSSGMAKSSKPIHKMDLPNYSVPCGDGDKIFGEGHGGSIYEKDVTCPTCRYILGLEN